MARAYQIDRYICGWDDNTSLPKRSFLSVPVYSGYAIINIVLSLALEISSAF